MNNQTFIIEFKDDLKKVDSKEIPVNTLISGISPIGKYMVFGLVKTKDGHKIVEEYDNGEVIDIEKMIDIKIHDILDENRKSTHQLMYMATDKLATAIYYLNPPRNKKRKLWVAEIHKTTDNTFNLKWKDKPIQVWVRI